MIARPLDPIEIVENAKDRVHAQHLAGYPWVVATMVLSHVRWYLQHGVAAGPESMAGKYIVGGRDYALTRDTPQSGVLRNGE